MGQRSLVPTWRGKNLLSSPLVYLVLAIGLLALSLPFAQWARSTWADVGPRLKPAPIDGDRAYKYLKDVCAVGPHTAGSAANGKVRAMVSKHFQKMGAKVREQPFTANDPRTGERLEMVNLIGSWNPERAKRVVIGAHYDTRPFPDEEPDPARRNIPFIGANDPGSGIALLMELAHHLETLPTAWGVDLVLFDGEELVYGRQGDYFLGSKEFARAYVEDVDSRKTPSRYVAGLVLDMVGGRDLQIKQEPYSLDYAPQLVHDLWTTARRLKVKAFRDRVGRAVMDDHLPLNNGGIPTVDIIDFDYPYWHTSRDLPENCSGASLAQVGRVITAWLSSQAGRGR